MRALIDAMRDAIERGITEQEAAELDLDFHDLIYDAANHRRLKDAWTNMRPQIHVLLLNRNVADVDFREMLVTGTSGIARRHRHRPIRIARRSRCASILAVPTNGSAGAWNVNSNSRRQSAASTDKENAARAR